MNDAEAVVILTEMLKRSDLSSEEYEALKTAIGILGWTKLFEGRVQSMKNAKKKREQIGD